MDRWVVAWHGSSSGSGGGSDGYWYLAQFVTSDVQDVTVTLGNISHTVTPFEGIVCDAWQYDPDFMTGYEVTHMTIAGKVIDGPPDDPTFVRSTYDVATLHNIDAALSWVWESQRRIERYVFETRRRQSGEKFTLDEFRRATASRFEGHYVLVSAKQALYALKDLQVGPKLSSKLGRRVALLRNIYEHEEDDPNGRSGKKYLEEFPEEFPWGSGFNQSEHRIGGLILEDLWGELAQIEIELWRLKGNDRGSLRSLPRPFPIPAEAHYLGARAW